MPNGKGGRGTPNQEPSTPRGHRRKKNTEEYQKNLSARKQQAHPVGRWDNGGARGPLKGPAKRPPNTPQERWNNYLEGRADQL